VDVQQQCAALNEIPSRAYGPPATPVRPFALSINTDLQLTWLTTPTTKRRQHKPHLQMAQELSSSIPLRQNPTPPHPTHQSITTQLSMASPNEHFTITCQKNSSLPSPPPALLTPASMSQIRLGVQPARTPSHLAYISPAGTYNRKTAP
jgi:hypothetical protein